MHHTKSWMLSLALFLAALALPAVATAQDGNDVVGHWEGYSSRGNYVIIVISPNEGGDFTADVTVIDGGIGGEAANEAYGVAVSELGPNHTEFDVSGEMGRLEAFWYGPSAMQLIIASDLIVILARVTYPEMSVLATLGADTEVEEGGEEAPVPEPAGEEGGAPE